MHAARAPRTLAISNRHTLVSDDLAGWVVGLSTAGVDAIQLREKDLSDSALERLARVLASAEGDVELLVNQRCDLALAYGFRGVHLRGDSPPVERIRRHWPDLVIGKSTHGLDEIRSARDGGADYVTLSPIFPPLSKPASLPPVGLETLARAADLGIAVLALGGITIERLPAVRAAGAAGFAAITLFGEIGSAKTAVEAATRLWPRPSMHSAASR